MATNVCNSCNVTFELADAKAHYATAFHNANVKRRLADLAPLTLASFSRAAAAAASAAAAREKEASVSGARSARRRFTFALWKAVA